MESQERKKFRPDLNQELFGPVAESEAEIKAVNFLPQIQTRKKIWKILILRQKRETFLHYFQLQMRERIQQSFHNKS